ncbi:glycosyltransferase family 9 protein [Bordetella genomosp. 13]|uniref:glycosyltransferase family 9 protein n=1 Tax=Bordetella genomosp. 13 TaxID=463040 RepID=UPI00119EA284|nr:glycosyltransferase family 9 protein [Bordetella genomosp. 13]
MNARDSVIVDEASGAEASRVWREARRILCVRLDGMGDVLMSTPAMRALKQGAPDRRLALMASAAGAALQPFLPDVDTVMRYDCAWVRNGAQGNQADLDAVARIRAWRPDAAVIFTVYSQSPLPAAMLCHLAGVPRVLAHCRENPYRLITDWRRESDADGGMRHEVRRQLDLVASVGAVADDRSLSFRVRDLDRQSLRAKVRAHGVADEEDWIAIHGGASASSRRYPSGLLAQAIDALRAEGRRLLLLGSPEDGGLAPEIARRREHLPGLVDLSGQLSLGELGAAIERAAVLVCNNSGPAHIAAALHVPVVDLYALTNPQHTPWNTAHRVLYRDVPCRNCYRSTCPEGHHACLAGVPPEAVADAARELLAQGAGREPASPPQGRSACIH